MINEYYNDLANSYDIKPECATERVDDNLWKILNLIIPRTKM